MMRSFSTIVSDLFYSAIPKNSYLRTGVGENNLIITAPHGGNIKPLFIPRRKGGVQVQDTYSRRLTEKIIEYLDEKPYYIISDIHRSRIDLNRNIWEACEGNYRAEKIWNSWDKTIQRFTNEVIHKYRYGLYIDIHSHNDGDYFELGYNLSAKDYIKLFDEMDVTGSSLDSLGYDLHDMVFGSYSLKYSLEDWGYDIFFPTKNEVYFNGGRNIEVYSGNGIGAIQIECPVSILKDDLDWVAFALAESIAKFQRGFTQP
jgi:hypothetical protein